MMLAVFMMVGPLLGTFVFQQYGIYLSLAVVGGAFLAPLLS